jgi:hypothetical protein
MEWRKEGNEIKTPNLDQIEIILGYKAYADWKATENFKAGGWLDLNQLEELAKPLLIKIKETSKK